MTSPREFWKCPLAVAWALAQLGCGAGDAAPTPIAIDGSADRDAVPIDAGLTVDDGVISLPLAVDDHYAVSGYIGDGAIPDAISHTTTCPQRAGEATGQCHHFTWVPAEIGWAGVFWQYPANNWGDTGQPGLAIAPGATGVSFYAWSDSGGESISFGAGMEDTDAFSILAPATVLTDTPTRYTLALADVDYGSDVIGGFTWNAGSSPAAGISFYVDDIQWQASGSDPGGGKWPPGPDVADGVSLRVRNLCSTSLWIHGEAIQGVLTPDNVQLEPGAIQNYAAPRAWTGGRVTAFRTGPGAGEIEKAEVTFDDLGAAGTRLNYNITYVDWVGLPVQVVGVGGNCNAASHTTGCTVPTSEIASSCPEDFLLDGGRCMSSRSYCLSAENQGSAFCHALDGAIAACTACAPATTPEVYACSGPYATEPRLCAALNRGMTHDPDTPDASQYYLSPPYNTYAKWVHDLCPGVYAFSYDDWLGQGGFRSCVGDELRITFCPEG